MARPTDDRPAAASSDVAGTRTWVGVVAPLAVFVAALVAFLPALDNGFVNWDDDRVLLQNEHFRGLGWAQLQWMSRAYWLGHYHPLTWLSFAIDGRIWGFGERGAFGFHLTNIVLHAASAVLLYFLARRLLGLALRDARELPKAALPLAAASTALLFAVHPLRVESVAWITERRDVLSLVFLLPCVLAYLRYASCARGRRGWYATSVLLLLLSLLCKAWGMVLPAVLLILDWYPLRRLDSASAKLEFRRLAMLLVEKLPFVALAGWAGYHAVQAQSSAAYTLKTLTEHGWLARLAQSLYGISFYLWKTLLPLNLLPIYEIPVHMNPFAPRFIAAAVVTIAITALVIMLRRRWPAGLALWACYVVILSPVLGWAQAGPQLVADRYSYVACLPWALLAGAAALFVARPFRWDRVRLVVAVAIAVLATLGVLTWRQTRIWHDSRTLWTYTLALAPDSYNAHTNLAVDLQQSGAVDAAELHYRAALGIDPDGAEALGAYGGLLSDRGQYTEALAYLQRGLARNPNPAEIWFNLALTLQRLGRNDAAMALYRERLALDRTTDQQAVLYSGLGAALGSLGRMSEAADCFRQAGALAPQDALPQYNLGLALRKLGDAPGALQAFDAALRLTPDAAGAAPYAPQRACHLDALLAAGDVCAARGDRARARDYFQRAAQFAPQDGRSAERLRRLDRP